MSNDNTQDAAEPSLASAGSVGEVLAKGIADIIRIAAEPDWIPVTERLPAKDLMVLVWSQSDGLHLARLDLWRQWRDADENFGKKITHWMPLPAPPTDGK
jgi:hypothetical protein